MSTAKRRIWVQPLDEHQRSLAKRSFTTRRVPDEAMRTTIGGTLRPRAGDLVLASVDRLGHHRRIERPDGRRSALHVGDEIIVAYGDRYAPDQFEAHVPPTLGRTQLVASGGIASSMVSRSMDVRNATDILPIGLIGDGRGRPLNLADFALSPVLEPATPPRTVAVIGTSMNSGKTTTVHYLVHGLSRAGYRPAATKVTGTGSGNDFWVMLDAGAHTMLDFTDVGFSSTYRQPLALLERKVVELVEHLTASGSGVNFIEVADGIYQQETAQLIDSDVFQSVVDVVVFAANDAMGAAMGVNHLRERGVEVVAVSGRLTRSPLARREAEQATGLPVLGIAELMQPALVRDLLGLQAPVVDPSREAVATDEAPLPWPENSGEPWPGEEHDEDRPSFLQESLARAEALLPDERIPEQR